MTLSSASPSSPPLSSACATPANSRVAGICLTVFLVAGLLTVLYSATLGGVSLTKPPVNWSTFLSGKTTQQIADSLAETPLPQAAAKLERGLSWLAIGDLGPRVRQGCPRWLFLSDEMTVHRHAEANAAARAAEVLQVKDRLARQGVALLVAIVPDKSRIAASQLCGLRRPASFVHRVDTWVQAVPGVNVLSLANAMQDPAARYFLRTDTHWNEDGAAVAAKAIVQRLREPGKFVLPLPTLQMRTDVSAPVPRAGDLVRLAGIDWLPASLQPPPDIVRRTRFIEPGTADNGATRNLSGDDAAASQTEDDLFGDTGLPSIALIGTSFSRNASFVPFLEMALGMRVGNFARDGGEFAGAANAYFNSPSFKDTPPKLVIWEIPERSLQRPLGGEPAIWTTTAPK